MDLKKLGSFVLFLLIFSTALYAKNFDFDLNQTELSNLLELTSEKAITFQDLEKWDGMIKKLREKKNLDQENYYRFYPYFYHAHRAFAEASYALRGKYAGTLTPISKFVIRLFFPDYEIDSGDTDFYSEKIAYLIGKKLEERFKKEQSQIHAIKIEEKKDYWYGKEPFGIKIPTLEPWYLASADQFRVPKPPSPNDPFWQKQLAKVKSEMKKTTDLQKNEIVFWAGMLIPDTSDWKTIADQYIAEKHSSLKKMLEVRAVLAAVLCDANIACYDSKYTYLVRRPNMLDPDLKTYIPTPPHPSHPAAHATASYAAATILSYYFPERKIGWNKLAGNASLSRIRAGIHFPTDIEEGKTQGIKVAKFALSQVEGR